MTHLKRAIQESKEREEKATKGPWKANHGLIECTFSNGNTYRIATIDFGETMKRLTEILKRCEAATPGPYVLDYYNENWANVWPQNGPVKTSKPVMIAKGVKRENAEFFQCARSDLPLVTQALMKAVEAMEAVTTVQHSHYLSESRIIQCLAEIEKLLETEK